MKPMSLNVKQSNQGKPNGLLNIQNVQNNQQFNLVSLPTTTKQLPKLVPLGILSQPNNNVLNVKST